MGAVEVKIEIGDSGSGGNLAERRRTSRQGLALECTVRERSRTAIPATASDFSASGIGIRSHFSALPGNHIWVKVNGLESLSGRVAWSNGSVAGIEFEIPLHPAVTQRFVPNVSMEALPHPPLNQDASNVSEPNPLLSRREQIMQGVSGSDLSPLKRRKQPTGVGISGSISRTFARKTDHRHELRFRNPTTSGQMDLTISARPAQIEDISSSGLRVCTDFEAQIGADLRVEFGDFEPIVGKLIWQGKGEIGISLPPQSIDLHGS
jgi:hypothetical protein